MIKLDHRIKNLEQDIAFLQTELLDLELRKEAAELFGDKTTAGNYEKDMAEITATLQRMQHDLAALDPALSFATLIR
ncbi:hypothetical protein AHMF7605_26185 [Adhaeribacter arboris]|uniref:Uncharacterized protein n=1 Tax=Adhaeribacter arboris TaxID=2072846 RepID=A0A2T2YMK9_9BACT|nr:hypothetical protein [Adhaeribacter arboris]PSR56735.1 hypothetical protein AHMF7605_26185 [Adhaeribacter arboris]